MEQKKKKKSAKNRAGKNCGGGRGGDRRPETIDSASFDKAKGETKKGGVVRLGNSREDTNPP